MSISGSGNVVSNNNNPAVASMAVDGSTIYAPGDAVTEYAVIIIGANNTCTDNGGNAAINIINSDDNVVIGNYAEGGIKIFSFVAGSADDNGACHPCSAAHGGSQPALSPRSHSNLRRQCSSITLCGPRPTKRSGTRPPPSWPKLVGTLCSTTSSGASGAWTRTTAS